jgi:hypothetical protein
MGDPNSNAASATNGAIFLMLAFIGAMMASTVGVGFYLYRRATAPIPPHVALAEELSDDNDSTPHA